MTLRGHRDSRSWPCEQRPFSCDAAGLASLDCSSHLLAATLAHSSASTRADAEKDPVLKAMLTELDRSMSQLQLPGFEKPFFIQYRIEDVDDFETRADYGATRRLQHSHAARRARHRARRRLQDRQLRPARRRRARVGRARRRSHRPALCAVDRHRPGLQERARRLRAKAGRAEAGADAAAGRRLQPAKSP